MKPYREIKDLESENSFIRTFSNDLNEDDLVWHRDIEDRIIEVINNNGNWQFQFDNMLPIILNKTIFIKKGEFHRLIKGNGELKLKVIRL